MRTAAILLIFSAMAAGQPRPATYAIINVRVNSDGDAAFRFRGADVVNHFDFPFVARSLLHCDWRSQPGEDEYVVGVCTHLLKRQASGIDDRLAFSPLVAWMRAAGFESVMIQVSLEEHRRLIADPADGWNAADFFSFRAYDFLSRSAVELPPPLRIHTEPPPRRTPVSLALLMVLVIPACAAIALRKITRSQGAQVWMSWIQLGTWFFWLFTMPPGRVVELMTGLPQNVFLHMVAGAWTFVLPPITGSAAAFIVLSDLLLPNTKDLSVANLLRRYWLLPAGMVMIFGCFALGLAFVFVDVRAVFAAIALGLVTGGACIWMAMGSNGGVRVLESGPLHDRFTQLARGAGVRMKGLSILTKWGPDQANAFAWIPARRVYVADSLLSVLNRRETDVVLAHELGHFRDLPRPSFPNLCFPYMIVYTLSITLLAEQWQWAEPYLVFVALALFFAGAKFKRGGEFAADRWAASLTKDPLALISGFGRLVRVRRLPLYWSPLAGSIISHPSFHSRVLALARTWGIPESQALGILENPDSAPELLSKGERYETVGDSGSGVVFSREKKMLHLGRSSILYAALIPTLVCVWSALADWILSSVLMFVIGLPFVAWFGGRIIVWSHRRYLRRAAREIGLRLPQGVPGEIVGLLPGDDLIPFEGFYIWDFGKLGGWRDHLAYRGEKCQFSARRDSIAGIEAVSRRVGLNRVHAVRIRTHHGSFFILPAGATTRQSAVELEHQWLTWWMSDTPPASAPPPQCDLPVRPVEPTPANPVRPMMVFLFVQFTILTGLAPWRAAVAAPCLYFLTMLPALVRWKNLPAMSPGVRTPHGAAGDPRPLSARLEDDERAAQSAYALLQQTNGAAPAEEERLLEQARDICERLIERSPRYLFGLGVLSATLYILAVRKSRQEAEQLYARAQEAAEAACAMNREDPVQVEILGRILLRRALIHRDVAGDEFLQRARATLERALQMAPGLDNARILWAHVLAEQSRRNPCDATDRTLVQARGVFDAAAQTSSDEAAIHRGLAMIAFAQAMRLSGEGRIRRLQEAKEKFLASEMRDAGTGAYRAACVCARLGEEDECRKWLEQSHEPGVLVTRDEVLEEPHFEAMRDREWFQAIAGAPVLR